MRVAMEMLKLQWIDSYKKRLLTRYKNNKG